MNTLGVSSRNELKRSYVVVADPRRLWMVQVASYTQHFSFQQIMTHLGDEHARRDSTNRFNLTAE